MSLLNKYPCANITAPTSLSFSSASFSILSAVVATVGNLLVVLAVLLDPHKDLRRSPFNYFVASLALADLIIGLFISPLGAIHFIFEGLKQINQELRVWFHTTYFISCTASLLSLTALALERYTAITYPLIYRTKLNPVRAFFVSVLVWIVSILLASIYFAVGYNKFRFVLANTAIAVTFAVLIFTNVKIFKYLREQVHQWDNFHDSTEENAVKKQAIKWEKKITKTLFIALMLFLACYLPSCVCIYIINFCFTCNCVFIHWVKDIQWALVVANSSVNPFVYAWKLETFRKAFMSILTCRACSKWQNSTSVNIQLSILNTNTNNSTNNPASGLPNPPVEIQM